MKAPVIQAWQKPVHITSRSVLVKDANKNQKWTFLTPVPYKMNHQSISASTDIEMFGADAKMIQKALITDIPYGTFKLYDLAYLDGATPTGEVTIGDNANYEVNRIMEPQNMSYTEFFKKRTGL